MCILIAKAKTARKPSLDEIKNSANANPDGCGVAWVQNKQIHCAHRRTLDDNFEKILQSIPDNAPAIYHFRIATHGTVNERNCHPFVSDDGKTAFAHNGILSIQNDKEKDWTDSETAFRYLFLPILKTCKIDSAGFTAAINTIIGSSKFAFLQSNGTLTTFGNFINDGGLLFSNASYLPRPTYSTISTRSLDNYKNSFKTYGWYDEYEQQYDAAYMEIDDDFLSLVADANGEVPDSITADVLDEYADLYCNELSMVYDKLKRIDYKAMLKEMATYYGILIVKNDDDEYEYESERMVAAV